MLLTVVSGRLMTITVHVYNSERKCIEVNRFVCRLARHGKLMTCPNRLLESLEH